MQILRGKCAFLIGLGFLAALPGLWHAGRLLLHLVQPYGRFQHQQNFKALSANIGHHAGDLGRLGHTLMNGLAQLLNQLAEFLIQVRTSISRLAAWARNIRCSYLNV